MTSHPQQDVCCLMGDPIAGNPTQYMLEQAIEAGRLDWRFLTFKIPRLDFEGALRGARIFGFRGIMLTSPHDVAVLPYLEEVSQVAQLSGQVNCITQIAGRLSGENTLGSALRHLVQQSTDLSDAQVTILGEGTQAKTIAAELATAGAREIVFAVSEPDSLAEYAVKLTEQTDLQSARCEAATADAPLAIGDECRLLVSTLSQGNGMAPEGLPLELDAIPRSAVVADLAYNPPNTPLLKAAKDSGCTTIDGLSILIEKVALAFETWTGSTADRQAMLDAVEEFLVL